MTALQLRVKRMITEQLEKEREQLKAAKIEHEQEITNQKKKYDALKDLQFDESKKQQEDVERLTSELEQTKKQLEDKENEANSQQATWNPDQEDKIQSIKDALQQEIQQKVEKFE